MTSKFKRLDIYFLDQEQPTTCPKCGARTDFTEINELQQYHICLSSLCKFKFIGEFEEESLYSKKD